MVVAQSAEENHSVGVSEVKVWRVGQSQASLALLSLALNGTEAASSRRLVQTDFHIFQRSRMLQTSSALATEEGGCQREGVPVDVLLGDVEGRPRERIPSSPGYLGLVGLSR
jgi:hypothetical protein